MEFKIGDVVINKYNNRKMTINHKISTNWVTCMFFDDNLILRYGMFASSELYKKENIFNIPKKILKEICKNYGSIS